MKLGVNIDHVATLREARYRGRERAEPDLIAAARQCEEAGADGITVHLREDRRHIQDHDVRRLRQILTTRLNLEMSIAPEIVDIALEVKPDVVCVVPERREEVTTEGGLDVVQQKARVTEVRQRMNDAGIDVSLFVAPDAQQVEAASLVGAQFVELHTGAFAETYPENSTEELDRLILAAQQAHTLGLKVNAGHGLNTSNVLSLFAVPYLVELNIGHSIVSRAITVGLTAAVEEMVKVLKKYKGGGS